MFFIISKGHRKCFQNAKHSDDRECCLHDWGRGETDLYKRKARNTVEEAVFARRVTKRLRLRNRTSVCVEMSDDLEFFQIIHQDGKYVKMSQEDANATSKEFVFATPISLRDTSS